MHRLMGLFRIWLKFEKYALIAERQLTAEILVLQFSKNVGI